jgi:hypothetical protein
MAQVIVHTAPEGNLVVTHPVNPNKTIDEIASAVVPEGIEWFAVEEDDLPAQKKLRNAWEYDGGVVVNISKAKTLTHSLRRKVRSIELAPHDDVIAKQIPGQMPHKRKLHVKQFVKNTQDAKRH